MIWLRLGFEEDKKFIWERKKKLRKGKVWIEEDLNWEERRQRSRLREIAKEEVKKEEEYGLKRIGLE